MTDHDVIVISGGSPGEHCAGALANGGLRVAVIERYLVGGECSCYACVPSKTLLCRGEAVRGAIEAGATARVDVQAALAYRDFMVSDYSRSGQQRRAVAAHAKYIDTQLRYRTIRGLLLARLRAFARGITVVLTTLLCAGALSSHVPGTPVADKPVPRRGQ